MSELDKLEAYLREHGYVFRRINDDQELMSRHQIIVYNKRGRRIWDAICHWGSHGFEEGLLEVMGKPVVRKSDGDDVVGWLTAQDVINRLEESNVSH